MNKHSVLNIHLPDMEFLQNEIKSELTGNMAVGSPSQRRNLEELTGQERATWRIKLATPKDWT